MKNLKKASQGSLGVFVSVPLRGNGYEKLFIFIQIGRITMQVSVPLRGNGYEKLS